MATQQQFQKGDLVELNAGGPVMTVYNPGHDGTYYDCQWFAGKKLESGRFAVESLKPAVVKPAVPLPDSASAKE